MHNVNELFFQSAKVAHHVCSHGVSTRSHTLTHLGLRGAKQHDTLDARLIEALCSAVQHSCTHHGNTQSHGALKGLGEDDVKTSEV